MRSYAQPRMTTKQLDNYGATILSDFGAESAPYVTYSFPATTIITPIMMYQKVHERREYTRKYRDAQVA